MTVATHDIELTVDGTAHELTVESRTFLAHALRDELGYTGPNVGCETGVCGACTVRVDSQTVKSCTMLAVRADGATVETVAGLADGDGLHPVQSAFREEHGLQCGYCTPGMVMSAVDLLERNPDPEKAEIREAIAGNLCRCTGYQNIIRAVETAAKSMDAAGDRHGEDTGADEPVPESSAVAGDPADHPDGER